ncbi:MAG: O-antigen ligase family protein [Actinobacteria bacterium]|nr:O-antigen ligase family protein [Actinomycetota bacterium]
MKQWILDRWLAYARTCLILAIFLAPVIFWRGTVDVFNLVKMTVILVAGSAALLFWASWSAETGIWMPRFNILYPALAFILAGIIATIFSENPALSVTGLYHRYGGLIPFILYVGLMVLIVGMYWERPLALRDIAKASAGASIVLAGYVLIQAAGLDWIPWRDSSGNPPEFPVGTMGNSNFAGGYLGIAIPFLIYMAASARREILRYFLFFAVAADLLALWFTQTRGGMIAAGVGIVTMVFLYRDRLPAWVRISTAVASALAIVVALVVLADIGSARTSGPFGRIEVFRTGTFNVRTYYWGTALRIFTDNPLVGTGLDTYYANYPLYRLPEDGAQLGLTITDKPHNIYLEYAANAGVLGAGAYLVTVGLGIWYGIRRARRVEGPEKFLLTSFTAVLTGYLAQGMFSIDVPPLAVMGWIALGGIAVIADPRVVVARETLMAEMAQQRKRMKRQGKAARKRERQVAHGPLRWPIHVAGVVIVGLLLFFGSRPLMADARAKTGEANQRVNGDVQAALGNFEEAIKLHPLEPSYRVQAGVIAETQAQQVQDPEEKERHIRAAVRRYQEAFRLQPGNIFYMMNLARIYALWGQIDNSKFAESDRWWKRAADHDPTDWEVHNRYALMLNEWANNVDNPEIRKRSIQQLRQVVRIRPGEVTAWINLGKIHASLGETTDAIEALERVLELDPANQEAKELLTTLRSSSL